MEMMSERLISEFACMEPIYADGVAGILNLGQNAAVYLFRYGYSAETRTICRVPAVVLIRPQASLCDLKRMLAIQVRPALVMAH